MKKYFFVASMICILGQPLFAESILELFNSDLVLNGDFQVRYQTEKKEADSQRHVNSQMRLRLGGEAKVSEETTVFFGMASGGANARSASHAFTTAFQSPDMRVDYAYAKLNQGRGLDILAGKMKQPLWMVSDLLWDWDIRPDGLFFKSFTDYKGANWFVNAGYLTMGEIVDQTGVHGANLIAIQPGFGLDIMEDINLKSAAGFMIFGSLQGKSVSNGATVSGLNNRIDGSGNLVYRYKILNVSSQVTIRNLGVPLTQVFSEIVLNSEPNKGNLGGFIGVRFGDKKVNEKGLWQFTGSYRYLQQDAWPDILPDAHSYGGQTGIKGFEMIFDYGLSENVKATLDVYMIDRL
ncbi:MAG: hypothetical protein ACI9BD_000695, partial [Candidatus Marinamargulisbacteria bacterium]